ncbi:MAG: hypothetical protein PUB20_07825 [Clostridia bacterium]|nr:hypothetical protein [Clostridia bacterium]
MIYADWMKYIKDDVKLCELVMPGAHNSGSYGMKGIACCQDGTLKEQFEYGIRHFCVRLDTDRKTGKIVFCHGITKGDSLENGMLELRQAMNEHPTEFFILDIREYYPQKFGPINLKYSADPKKVDEILERYICPSENAFTDFDSIGNVTMGDIRASGKRYILLNYREEYAHSVNCPHIFPWEKKVNGMKAFEFVTSTMDFFDKYDTDGLYWFQTQTTPNLGTDVGVTSPRKLDADVRMHFQAMIKTIANTPKYLKRANIISGDFMTEDYFKSREILLLNLKKNNVLPELSDEYLAGLSLGE